MPQPLATGFFFVWLVLFLHGCGAQRELSLPDTAVKEEGERIVGDFEGRLGEPLQRPESEAGSAGDTSKLPYLTASPEPPPKPPKKLPEKGYWLKGKRITIIQGEPIPATEVLKLLHGEGINIATTVPLDNYLYSGFGIENVRANVALRMILGSMGLDFDTDDIHRIVTVMPMPTKTWYLTLGNRVATYKSESSNSSDSGSGGSGSSSSSSSSGSGGSGGSGDTEKFFEPSNTYSGEVNSSGERTLSVTDDLWSRLEEELETRMKIMLMKPVEEEDEEEEEEETGMAALDDPAAMAGGMPAAPRMPPDVRYEKGEFSFEETVVGQFSLNPETGAIFVQAPQWIIDELDKYIVRIRNQYDTVIGFQGQVLLVTTTQDKSEGLDLAAFSSFLSKGEMKFYWSNNALGGVTITDPTDASSGSLSLGDPTAIGKTNVGIGNRSNSLRVFNNYLSSFGKVTVAQRPMISTTSGIPAEVSKFQIQYYNTVSQNTATGDSGAAALATENVLIPVEFGTLLRILPHYDPDKDIVRARVVLKQKLNAGTQEQKQYLTSGNGVREVTTEIPVVTNLDISGELLLRDGDLVVVGGQTEHSESSGNSGIMGTENNRWLSPITRTKRRSGEVSTYFFALRMNVLRR